MSELKANTLTQAPPAEEQKTPRTTEPPAPAPPAPRSKTVRIFVIASIVIFGLLIWKLFFASPSLPPSIVALSGRIEGDDSAVAPKTSGKVLDVTVREGDSVTAGQVIARLDDAQVRAREQQARAGLVQAQAQTQAAHDQIA